MVGALAIGKKAVTFGYKRYGLPGAIMAGGVTAIGYVVVKRALKAAVDENGLDAVRETEPLESAIDEDELESAVDIEVVQSAAEEEADELSKTAESTNEDQSGGKSDEEVAS